LSNVALDTIPQWPQRPEPGSSRVGSSSADTSPNRFDALLDNTSGDARPAPSEQYERSRTPDRRDDTRAADDRAAAQSRTGDARAAGRQKAADDRAAQVDDAKTQQDSDKAAAAKDRPAAGASDTTQAKAKPAAKPADATQAQDKPAAKASDATPATAAETPAQPLDAVTAEAQAKVVPPQAAAAVGEAVTSDKKTGNTDKTDKTDKTAETDKGTTATATTAPDPNAAPVQVPVVAVPVAPLPTIDPSAGAASTASNSATVDAATIAGSVPQTVDAEAAKQATTAASAESVDAKAAGTAQQASFKALAEAAGAKPQADTDVKVDLAGKPKAAQPTSAHAKTAAAADQAKSSAANVAETVDISADTQIVPVARTPHLIPISAEHVTTVAHPAASDVRADAITATAVAQTGSNAPILPLNLAQPIALPLSTMFQVAAPKADVTVDAAVPVAGLAVEIVSRAQEGGKRFDIRLDPPELGRVDVRLNVDDNGKVTSHLVVERSETLDLLRRDQPQLERALQQAGLNTDGGLQFSLRDQNSAQRDQTPRDNGANTSQLIVPDDEAAAAEAARRGYGRLLGRAGGVDIRI
jgi:chemotaxis protein MotD